MTSASLKDPLKNSTTSIFSTGAKNEFGSRSGSLSLLTDAFTENWIITPIFRASLIEYGTRIKTIERALKAEITQDEAVKRHAVDKQKWRFSFFDIFKPKIAFNKLVNKLLYQFQKSHRSDFDSEFRKVFQEGIPLEKHLVKTSDNHSVELWFAKHQNPEAKTKIIPRFLINLLTNTWNNQEAICKLKGKVKHIKIMHGKNDQVIPIQDSRDLYKQAQSYSISSELIELENIGHNDIKRGMKS